LVRSRAQDRAKGSLVDKALKELRASEEYIIRSIKHPEFTPEPLGDHLYSPDTPLIATSTRTRFH